jgi:hypothetical protein
VVYSLRVAVTLDPARSTGAVKTSEKPGPPPERVKLMPEHGVDVPLWPRTPDTDALIPPDLLERLARWQQVFDDYFDHVIGWKGDTVRLPWVGYVLEVDVWPLKGT